MYGNHRQLENNMSIALESMNVIQVDVKREFLCVLPNVRRINNNFMLNVPQKDDVQIHAIRLGQRFICFARIFPRIPFRLWKRNRVIKKFVHRSAKKRQTYCQLTALAFCELFKINLKKEEKIKI